LAASIVTRLTIKAGDLEKEVVKNGTAANQNTTSND